MIISRTMKQTALATLLAGAALAPQAQAAGFALVTNGNDQGQGSLRQALETQANQIFILPVVSKINIETSLDYSGQDALTIFGTGQTIKADSNVTLLNVSEGADLYLANLAFEGRKGYSINNRGDQGEEAGKGIFVDVRDDQEGLVIVGLENVSVSGVANHGIHISDCSLADDCGAGSGGAGTGSAASIYLNLRNVTINDVGNGKFDADGLRVDDRGEGDIFLFARDSRFTQVGADGVELDEGGAGHIYTRIQNSDFSDNGAYCDPDLLAPYLPAEPEGEFDESEHVSEADIPGPITGSPDDSCFEREVDFYDSGLVEEYEIAIDLDDGIDLDEADAGSLVATLRDSTISNNRDEGMDFDEAGAGNVWVNLVRTRAFGNTDDGYKVSEEDDGDVIGRLRQVTSTDNGGKGIVFEEENDGDLSVSVVRSYTANNDDSDDTGIEVAEDDDGEGKLRVRASQITDGIDTDGVDEF
ncbi:hypothetical protein QQM79_15610 [Marinobacteraceae bacterium S3BR75-40.1]